MRKLFARLFKKIHSNDHNLIGAMQEVVEAKANLTRRKEFSPFVAFPNVSEVRIEVSGWDELMLKGGLKKRVDGGKMHYVKYKNAKLNRFALRSINRLRAANRPRIYGGIVEHLIKRSKVFFLLGLKHIEPRGHRDIPFYNILKLYRDYKKLAYQDLKSIDFKRVYIKKANGKWRGLGVPTRLGRLYLHMGNQFLVLRYEHTISATQHGFRPFKGTLTAWIDVLKNMNKYDYIYEYDFQNFFGEIKLEYVDNFFMELSMPDHLIQMFNRINRSLPKLTDTDLIDESKTRRLMDVMNMIVPLRGHPNSIPLHPQNAAGMPQGAPTSPFISILVLDRVMKMNSVIAKLLQIGYADDGLLMSNTPIEEIPLDITKPGTSPDPVIRVLEDHTMIRAGIRFSIEKSGYVKYAGKGIKPLKFLGLVYDGVKDMFYADTRNGATLIMDKQDLIQAFNSRESPYKEKDSKFSGNSFIESSLKGGIQSRLYSDSWHLEDYFQDFRLRYAKGSGVSHYIQHVDSLGELKNAEALQLTVFNSSSICLVSALEALKDSERHQFRTKKLKRATKEGITRLYTIQPRKDITKLFKEKRV